MANLNLIVYRVIVTYVECDFNLYKTSKLLNLNRSNLYRHLRKFEVSKGDDIQSLLMTVEEGTRKLSEQGRMIYDLSKKIIECADLIDYVGWVAI